MYFGVVSPHRSTGGSGGLFHSGQWRLNNGYQEKEVRDEEVWPQVRLEEEGDEEGGQEAQVVLRRCA